MKKQSSGPLKLIFLLIAVLIGGAGYYLYNQRYSLQGQLDHIGELVDTSYRLKLNSEVELDLIYKPEALTQMDILLEKNPDLEALRMRMDALKISAVKRQYQPWTHMAEYAKALITEVNPNLNAILLPRSHTPELIFSKAADEQVYALLDNRFPEPLAKSWARAPFHYVEQDAAMTYLAAISRPEVKAGSFVAWTPSNPYYQTPPHGFDQTLRVLGTLPFERIFGALPMDTYKPQKKKHSEKDTHQEATLTKIEDSTDKPKENKENNKEPEEVITFVKPAGTTELYRMDGDKREVLDVIIRYDLVTLPVSQLEKPENKRKYTVIPGKTYTLSALQNFIYNKNLFSAELRTMRSIQLDPNRIVNAWEPGNSIPRICLPPSP